MIDTSVIWYLLPLFVGTAIYWYLTKPYNHWSSRGVCYLKPIILIGNYKEKILFRQSLHSIQRDLYNRCKGNKYAGVFEGRQPYLMILDPELIKQMFVRDADFFIDRPLPRFNPSLCTEKMLLSLRGEKWKSIRTLLTPAFTSSKIKYMEVLVRDCAKQMENYLDRTITKMENSNTYEGIEMKSIFGRYTVDTIVSCAFGIEIDSFKDPNSEFYKKVTKLDTLSVVEMLKLGIIIFLIPKFSRYFSLSILNIKVINFFCDVIKKEISRRRKHPESRRNDILQMLLDAQVDEDKNVKNLKHHDCFPEQSTEKTRASQVLTEDIIIAQSVLFLIGGYESSSSLLTFACFELALNHDIQDKLREEVISVLDKYKGEFNYSALSEMTYMEMVFYETLRKHPLFPRTSRECIKQYEIPGSKLVINPGERIYISILGMHYDPEYFPYPDKFDPERFSPENKNTRSKYVFLPFGVGPRRCLGERFAMMNAKSALAHLLKKYKLTVCDKTEIPYTHNNFSVSLQPKNGIWLNVKKL